jgi:quercetin dioxygenase-like cupin family protein
MASSTAGSADRRNDRQWIEVRGGREVTYTEHPVRDERVEFLNEPEDPSTGPLTLTFTLGVGHEVDEHTHPEQKETITVNRGAIRATIDGDERLLEVGDHERIPSGIPHGYRVVSDEEAVLAVSITPALEFKEFVIAEHALGADDYPESGLNLPYFTVVTNRHGPMIAPPTTGVGTKLFGAALSLVARIRGLEVPDDPLPVRTVDEEEVASGREPPTRP